MSRVRQSHCEIMDTKLGARSRIPTEMRHLFVTYKNCYLPKDHHHLGMGMVTRVYFCKPTQRRNACFMSHTRNRTRVTILYRRLQDAKSRAATLLEYNSPIRRLN